MGVWVCVRARVCARTCVDFKELAHVIMEAVKSNVCRVSRQAGHPGKS